MDRNLKHSLALFGLSLTIGCAQATVSDRPVGSGTGSGGSGPGGSSGVTYLPDGGVILNPTTTTEKEPDPCPDPDACPDFPESPVIDKGSGAPDNSATQFSGDPSGTGPCIVEPEDGAMFPYNWLRPRFRWTGGSGLAQITITTKREKNPYVIYTKADNWKMDKDVWKNLAGHIRGEDITVQVRLQGGGASTIKFQVAPAGAAGSIVFWSADPTTVGKTPQTALDSDSKLAGFSVGEEGTVDALKLSQVKQTTLADSFALRPAISLPGGSLPAGTPRCMGCHVATPDPGYIAFVDHWPWNSVIAGIKVDNVGSTLPNMTAGGLADLNKPWSGMPAFSKAVWETGKRIMVATSSQTKEKEPWSTDNKLPAKLVWFNLDSPAPPESRKSNGGYLAESGVNYGEIARTGDANGAAFPTWSSDGKTIVYCSTKGGNLDGRLEVGATDLYSVPYNDGNGGAAKPIAGASEAGFEEYYPAFSPDGKFILYDRIPAGGKMYANPSAEMYVVPLSGGTASRLRSNDPPACSGKKSPGINNHFPRWSPVVKSYNGKNYYWFIYSSNRMGLPAVNYKMEYNGATGTCEVSQLYLSLIVEEDGKLTSYPSIYLWNQSTSTVNTTPVWDVLEIPPVKIL